MICFFLESSVLHRIRDDITERTDATSDNIWVLSDSGRGPSGMEKILKASKESKSSMVVRQMSASLGIISSVNRLSAHHLAAACLNDASCFCSIWTQSCESDHFYI